MNSSGNEYMSHGDRISNLPHDVISNILSYLPTIDAVRTCVLSRDWEYKWTSIFNMDIHDEGKLLHDKDRDASFITFVNSVLFPYKSRIRSFHLVCDKGCDRHHLRKWVSTILRRQVQILDILAVNCGTIDLPRCLSSCTSLIELSLSFKCTLKVPTENCFQNLKRLRLCHANIQNEQSPNTSPLLLSFLVLEDLELQYCKWSNVSFVEIRAPALVHFEVWNYFYREDSDRRIKIYGPKLKTFISFDGLLAQFDLYAPSVSYVGLQHTLPFDAHGSRSYAILKSFPFVCVTITRQILKALLQLKPAVPPFGCLRKLILLYMIEIKDLLEFLRLAPVLELLIVDLSSWDAYDREQVETLPTCVISSLKNVTFLKFSGSDAHVALGKFFLENAKKLEKLFVQVVTETRMTASGITNLKSAIPDGSNCVMCKFPSLYPKNRRRRPWGCLKDQ